MENNKKEVLKVETIDETGQYFVSSATGTSVAEIAFCVSVIIKCLIRDGHLKEAEEFYQLIRKYVDDEQYAEVKEDGRK